MSDGIDRLQLRTSAAGNRNIAVFRDSMIGRYTDGPGYPMRGIKYREDLWFKKSVIMLMLAGKYSQGKAEPRMKVWFSSILVRR